MTFSHNNKPTTQRTNALILLTTVVLAGCSMTLPVQGSLGKTHEPFLGTATGYLDGSGKLSMTTQNGVACQGQFEYDNPRVSGTGTFDCDDGRKGDFKFTSSGNRGQGFGKTNKGEPFKFVFGHNRISTEW